ncbi:MAG: hypothetical protein U1E05_24580, partial [Patescibacteria group bacterium]|nr:hypothetical protein [Patescibacteria group bacterium]
PAVALRCDRDKVVPGETVRVFGAAEHAFQIPADAVPGARLWRCWEDAWMDFTVVPLVAARLATGRSLKLSLVSHLGQRAEATATLVGQTQPFVLEPDATASLEFSFARPEKEEVRELLLEVRAGELRYSRGWWLKAEKALVPLAEFGTNIAGGRRLRDGEEEPLDSASGAQVHWTERACGGETRPTLFMHPPYKTGTGCAYALFAPIDLPKEPAAALRCEIGKADGSDAGDGVLFRVAVVEQDGTETVVAQRQWMEHAWTPLEADLTRWAGQRVRLKLISDVGPANNSSGDWACWTGIRVESREPVLEVTLHEEPVALRFEPGPRPAEGLSAEQLRKAASATLHYQAIGLQCGGQYVSLGSLNGVPLGPVPSAGGNEQEGVWGEGRMPVGPEPIASLDLINRFTLDNPGRDCFKIRRVWLELVFPDGRSCTSRVSTPTFTQPPNWLYSEGTGVPFDEQIQVEIRF